MLLKLYFKLFVDFVPLLSVQRLELELLWCFLINISTLIQVDTQKRFKNHWYFIALHDTHRLSFYLTNSHIDGDEYKHPVARIGKEAVFPVGPTSFCFMFPDDCGFTFSPAGKRFENILGPWTSRFVDSCFQPYFISIKTLLNRLKLVQ